VSKEAPGVRYAEIDRETKETRVQVVLDLDGGTRRDILTGIGFFDHMLAQLAFHGHIDVGVAAEGDLDVDDHHTVEDVGIVFGRAFATALDGNENIVRYGSNHTVMDDALVLVALDISGRGLLCYDAPFHREMLGDLSTECVREFFRAFCLHAGINMHIRKIAGENDHHVCEAIFKGAGKALHAATRRTERLGSNSTKGHRD
jgi:imidazoleglycerol-phosphate dehydratase